MAAKMGDLFIKIGGDASSFAGEMGNVEKTAQASLGKISRYAAAATIAFAAAAGAAVIGAAKHFMTIGSAMLELSQKTGIPIETLTKFNYAAKQSGASLETIAIGIKVMQKAIVDTALIDSQYAGRFQEQVKEMAKTRDRDLLSHGKTAKERAAIENRYSESVRKAQASLALSGSSTQAAFQDLGLDLQKLKAMKPEEAFQLVLEALAGIPDATRRTAYAMAILGGSGTDLLPMLADGAQGLRALMEQSKKLAYQWSEEDARAAHVFGDRITDVRFVLEKLTLKIGKAAIPALTNLASKMTEWVNTKGDQFAEAVAKGVEKIGKWVTETLVPGLEKTGAFLSENSEIVKGCAKWLGIVLAINLAYQAVNVQLKIMAGLMALGGFGGAAAGGAAVGVAGRAAAGAGIGAAAGAAGGGLALGAGRFVGAISTASVGMWAFAAATVAAAAAIGLAGNYLLSRARKSYELESAASDIRSKEIAADAKRMRAEREAREARGAGYAQGTESQMGKPFVPRPPSWLGESNMMGELPELAAQRGRDTRATSERWARGEAVTQGGYQYAEVARKKVAPSPYTDMSQQISDAQERMSQLGQIAKREGIQVEQNIAGVTIVVQQMPTPAQFAELMNQYAAQGV